jgi:hypothetical protein
MRRALPAIAFIVLAQPAAVSTTTVIDSKPSCARCTIELVKLFTLGGPDDTVTYHPRYGLLAKADSRGNVYVGPLGNDRIAVYNSTGKLLRTLGRTGKGPGEFDFLLYLDVGPHDTLYAFDYGGGRANVFSPDHKYVRSSDQFGGQRHRHVILPSGQLFMLEPAQRIGDSVLALYSADGRLVRRYTPLAQDEWSIYYALGRSNRGAVWVAHPNVYQIDEYEMSGSIRRTLKRAADWWSKPSEQWTYYPRERKPEPALTSVHEDKRGYLWTTVRTGKADWRQLDKPGTNQMASQSELSKYYDTIVEVIDPVTGSLITSHRFPFLIGGIQTGNIVVTMHEDEDGNLLRDVYRIALKEK